MATDTAPPFAKTTCILCESNCGIEVRVEDGRFTRIKGNKAHVGSKGYTCEKALRLDHYQNHRTRLDSPLRRRADGTYEEIDWDTAIAEVAAKFAAVRDTHGGDKIFHYGGGGQGNHLGGAYGRGVQSTLGVKFRSNALAQEKTGEAYVEARLYYAHTRGDVEHTEVAVFVGKNPWMSHGFPEARRVMKEIAKDPDRSMVIIDPRRTKSAEMADYFLQVKPGTDAFCVAALVAILVRDGLLDDEFMAAHVTDAEPVLDALAHVPIEDYADRCGIPLEDLEAVARRIATADSCTVFEDLGIEQAPHSTLVSYLQRMLWILTGSFGKPGGMFPHTNLSQLGSGGGGANRQKYTPVTGAEIISGLTPCNSIANEVLTDHPDRIRAMIIESANPVHSLTESDRFREAMRSLEVSVVIDVAMTETARQADYVLPASSQYEKPESVFFTHEFPNNVYTLRKPIVPPLEGTLAEPEIHSRILEELGAYTDDDLAPLHAAAAESRSAFGAAFMELMAAKPELPSSGASILYRTLGPTLPDGMAEGAAVWFLAQMCAINHPIAVERAGFVAGDDGNAGDALFDAIIGSDDGVVFTKHVWEEAWDLLGVREDQKIRLNIPRLLELLTALPDAPRTYTSDEFPMVLSAGERRSFTANAIFRDPGWRKNGRDGAIRVSPHDALDLGLVDGDRARLVTQGGVTESPVEVDDAMQAGHISIPNGYGVDYPDENGEHGRVGIAPNELTHLGWEDEIAGTPWHKHVPARLEPISVQ